MCKFIINWKGIFIKVLELSLLELFKWMDHEHFYEVLPRNYSTIKFQMMIEPLNSQLTAIEDVIHNQ